MLIEPLLLTVAVNNAIRPYPPPVNTTVGGNPTRYPAPRSLIIVNDSINATAVETSTAPDGIQQAGDTVNDNKLSIL